MFSTDPKTTTSTQKVGKKLFALFISHNSKYYLKEFERFNIDGVDRYRLTWNWAACLFTFIWMASRKMYSWALLVFVITCFFAGIVHPIWLVNYAVHIFISSEVPVLEIFLNNLLMVLCGLSGNYIYYRHAKKKILNLVNQELTDSHDIAAYLEKEGGLNPWVVIIATPLLTVFLIYPWLLLVQ
jgi:hypothetical protein